MQKNRLIFSSLLKPYQHMVESLSISPYIKSLNFYLIFGECNKYRKIANFFGRTENVERKKFK